MRSGSASPSLAIETGRQCARHPVTGKKRDPAQRSREASHFHCASGFSECPSTRAHARLLGPCFKTGRVEYRPDSPPTLEALPKRTPASHDVSGLGVRPVPRPESDVQRGAGKPNPKQTTACSDRTPSPRDRSWPSKHRGKCTPLKPAWPSGPGSPRGGSPTRTERWSRGKGLNAPGRGVLRLHPFDSVRFHVLLNSLFKVLFNFPSRYLSAIGLVLSI